LHPPSPRKGRGAGQRPATKPTVIDGSRCPLPCAPTWGFLQAGQQRLLTYPAYARAERFPSASSLRARTRRLHVSATVILSGHLALPGPIAVLAFPVNGVVGFAVCGCNGVVTTSVLSGLPGPAAGWASMGASPMGYAMRGAMRQAARSADRTAAGASQSAGSGLPVERLQGGPVIGHTDDPVEAEADRVAGQVVGAGAFTGPGPQAGRLGVRLNAPRGIGAMAAGLGPGRPLDAATRAFFEPRFGGDLGHVGVHTGPAAAAAASSLGARAFTFGPHIAFNAGYGDTGTGAANRLLAHELAHVVEQTRRPMTPAVIRRSPLRARPPDPAVTTDPVPMQEDLGRFGKEEEESLRTVSPGVGQESRSEINVRASTDPGTGAKDVDYNFSASAKGQRGSISSNTNLHLHREADDKDVLVQPTNPELHLVGDPKLAKPYKATISYSRTISYADEYGRTLEVELQSTVLFSRESLQGTTAAQPEMTLDALEQRQGSAGYMSVRITGQGDLASLITRRCLPNSKTQFSRIAACPTRLPRV
jgi:Domain of unknown function (DUF4157)